MSSSVTTPSVYTLTKRFSWSILKLSGITLSGPVSGVWRTARGVCKWELLVSGDLCGNAKPFAAAPGPDVGVAAAARAAVRQRVARAGMDDREVAHHAHVHLMA